MANPITPIRKGLQRLQKDKNKIIRDALLDNRKFISFLNRRQLFSGQKADGSDMPPYVPNSESRHAPAKIKLFDTGDFYEGIEPLIGSDEFTMIGTDEKTNLLVGIYGNILGLTEESMDELKKKIHPQVIRNAKKTLKI